MTPSGSPSGSPSASSTPRPAPAPGTHRIRLGHRSFLLQVPAHLRQPAALVVVMGGINWSAHDTFVRTRLGGVAKSAGALVAYPEPIHGVWNAGTCCWGASADDVGFLARVQRAVASRATTDPHLQVLLGFSAGGMMAYRAACADSRWTSIVVLGATAVHSCRHPHPFTVTNLNGTHDTDVPWNGGYAHYTRVTTPPVWRVDRDLARAIHCGGARHSTSRGREITKYAGCRGGAQVRDIRIIGLRHHWPLREVDGYDMGPVMWHLALG